MSDTKPIADQIVAVRAFATMTERVADLIGCSYADAAVFLTKLGPFLERWNDTDFRAKLDRYCKAVADRPEVVTAVSKSGVVH